MEIKLSILIATMPIRLAEFTTLFTSLNSQGMFPNVEIIFDASMDYNIGTKRNLLLQRATGKYIVYIDDDDLISPSYISLILEAIKTNPDCVGISGIISTNGLNKKQWHISKDYGSWYEKDNIYYRTPNHISPVKRKLALQAMFPEISFGEDAEYSRRLLPLLKTEIKIEENIYHYRYVTKK